MLRGTMIEGIDQWEPITVTVVCGHVMEILERGLHAYVVDKIERTVVLFLHSIP